MACACPYSWYCSIVSFNKLNLAMRIIFRPKFILSFFLVLFFTSCTNSNNYPPIEVLHATFGYLDKTEEGTSWKISNTVPYKVGQKYAWKIDYRSNKKEITFKEALVLPEPSSNWQLSKELKPKISDDKKIAMIERTIANDGVLKGGWVIADGDPKGLTKIVIMIDGKKIHVFNFEIK